MSKLQIFYAEGGRYVSDEYSYASAGDIAFGGELNQTKLYGSQPIYSEPHPFMYISDAVSDANGVLKSQTPVAIERQNINGLTLLFDTAGGTHPKEVNVILMSKTKPNFTNRIETESYSLDMSGKISADGILRGYRIDPETGELVEDAGYMVSGIVSTTGGFTDTFYTRGIDWMSVDATKIGVAAYSMYWYGVRYTAKYKAFSTVEELLTEESGIGSITIDDKGDAQIRLSSFDRYANYILFCMPMSDTSPIVTIDEPITYGDEETEEPTNYVGASTAVPVSDTICAVDIAADDVTSIVVYMTDVNAPYVRHKLTSIYSGTMTLYSEDSIISCDIIEQIDVLSETFPNNICDIVMIEPNGIKYNPLVRQRIEVYQDGRLRGVFFIENVKKLGTNRYSITSHGITGELEKYTFYGDVYKNKDTERLIAEIFETAEIHYIMEDAPIVSKISGHLPISDCKTALRTVLFASGMTLDVSRSPHPRVRYIETLNPITERQITDTLIGESVTEDSPVARIETKTRVYINPDDDSEYSTTAVRCTHKEFGKGYKPIIIIPDQPSLIKRYTAINAAMTGSTANRILWDGTRYYTYSDGEGGTYNSDNWYVDLYPWAVRESTSQAYMSDAVGATIQYDNTMISPENANVIARRCMWWYWRGKTLDAGIVGDVSPGEIVEIEISDGVIFKGTVTQVRYSPVGSRMIQEVVLHGNDHGQNALRL